MGKNKYTKVNILSYKTKIIYVEKSKRVNIYLNKKIAVTRESIILRGIIGEG